MAPSGRVQLRPGSPGLPGAVLTWPRSRVTGRTVHAEDRGSFVCKSLVTAYSLCICSPGSWTLTPVKERGGGGGGALDHLQDKEHGSMSMHGGGGGGSGRGGRCVHGAGVGGAVGVHGGGREWEGGMELCI